jgi:tetratricopeptide (TPR) repeat protein
MTLNRLSRSQIESIATQVADGKALPSEVLDQLVQRTDGVPLYVEEMTKSVLESGVLKEADGQYELTGSVSSLSIPSTLQDSLMARLDRLVTAKAVAQYASVIGRQFSYELLQAVSELDEATLQRELGRLVEAELVYQRGVIPHATYLFKHALVQDAAYESLLRSTRQGYHRCIAEVLEQQFPEVADQQPELLAYHCTEAGLDEQAVTYWHQAGQRARSRSAHVEAASHLTAGLSVLKRMSDTPSRTQQELALHLPLGASLLITKSNGSSEVEQAYLRARELCEQLGETNQLARVLMALNGCYINRAEYDRALEMAVHLRELAERLNDSISLLVGHHALGMTLYYQGEFTAAHAHLEQAIALDMSQRKQFVSPSVALIARTANYFYASLVLWALGYPEQAFQRGQEALALARQHPNAFNLAATCDFLSQLHQRRGEVDRALELLDTSLTLSVDHHFPHWLATGAITTGWALNTQGHHEAGIAKIQEGIAARRDIFSEAARAWPLCLLAEAYGHVGQYTEGLNVLSEAQLFNEQTGDEMYAAEVPRLKGELLLRQSAENAVNAETCFQQALDVARSQQSKSFELRVATSLARLWQSQGKRRDAYDLLAPVYNWFTEGFDTADLMEATVLLDELEG